MWIQQGAWDLIPAAILLIVVTMLVSAATHDFPRLSPLATAVFGAPVLGTMLAPWVVTALLVHWQRKDRRERARWFEQAARDLEDEKAQRKLDRRRERRKRRTRERQRQKCEK